MRNKVILFYGLFFEKGNPHDWIPYGPIFVYSLLKDAGFDPILIHEHEISDYEKLIEMHVDDLLFFGVSAMTGHQITSGIKAVRLVRKYVPDVPVIWGGAHPTALPYQTLQSEHVDYVCVGQAKDNIIDFAKVLQDGEEIISVPDILTKKDAAIAANKRYTIKDYKTDYTHFPRIPWEDFDFSYMLSANRVLNYTASTGCPGNCSFCSWGGKHPWAHLPLNRVLDDIEYLVTRYGLSTIWFSDATLTTDKEFFLGLAQGILDRNLDIYWRSCGRIYDFRHFERKDFKLLEKSGFEMLFLGIENVNRQVQKLLHKVYDPGWITELLKKMNGFDIKVQLAFIFGVPNGPLNEIKENRAYVDKWKSINPLVYYGASFFTPYPSTVLADQVVSLGYSPVANFEEYGLFDGLCNNRYLNQSTVDAPWYSKKDRGKYIKQYFKLFPEPDGEFKNWRKKRKNKLVTSVTEGSRSSLTKKLS